MNKIKFIWIVVGLTILLLLLQNKYTDEFYMNQKTIELKSQACPSSGIYYDDSGSAIMEIRANLLNLNPPLGIKIILEELSEQGSDKQIKDETRNNLIRSAIYIGLPWIIILFMTIVLYIIDIFCQFKSCPPCKICQMRKAKKINDLKLTFTLGLIISIVTMGICIAGVVIGTQMDDNIEDIRCAMISLHTDIQDGTTYSSDTQLKKWNGLQGLNNQMQQIMYDFNSLIEKTQIISEKLNTDELDNDYQRLLEQNDRLDKLIIYNRGQSYYQANSALSYIQDGTNIEQNLFITSKLSITTPQKQLFYQIYQNTINQVRLVKERSKAIADDQINIKVSLEIAQQKISDWVISFNINIQDTYDSTEILQNNAEIMTLGLCLIFGIVLFLVIFSLISTVILYLIQSKLKISKNMLCFTFICYLFALIVCLIICIILSVTNSAIAETCQYFDDLTTDQLIFQNSNLLDSNNAFNEIFNECLFEDGDFLQLFNLNSSFTLIQQLDSSLSAFSEVKYIIQQAQTQCWNDMSKGKINLDTNELFLKDFINFQRIDSAEPNEEDGTNIQWIMKENFKICNEISVIESKSSCAQNQIYYNSSAEEQFPTQNENLCLQSSVFSYQYQNLQELFEGCIKTDLDNAYSFYQEQSTAWITPWHQELDIISLHEDNQQKLNQTLKAITDYSDEVQGYLVKYMLLLESVNCKFMKNSIDIFKNTICVHSFKSTYTIWILFCVVSCCLFLSHFYLVRVLLGIKHILEFEALPSVNNQNPQIN